MEDKLHELNDNFKSMVHIRENVIVIMDVVKQRIDKLKEMYNDFIKTNKKNLFIFGLDTFHFQNKLVDIEYDDMKRMFHAINNRMYCEYYKLYKIIVDYIVHHVTDKKILELIKTSNTFPVYKDLEPFKQYEFTYVQEIHENIILLLKAVCNYLNNKNYELQNHETKQLIGLNIDNFVNTFSYDIFVMREKINLFISYVDFFHNLHKKFLERFTKKMKFMLEQLNADIKFDNESLENEKVEKERTLKKMFQSGVKTVGNILGMLSKPSVIDNKESNNSEFINVEENVDLITFEDPHAVETVISETEVISETVISETVLSE